jgi:hypothetical protein
MGVALDRLKSVGIDYVKYIPLKWRASRSQFLKWINLWYIEFDHSSSANGDFETIFCSQPGIKGCLFSEK